jgi:ABC-type nickel/cobalt efflux system permease component RcnA
MVSTPDGEVKPVPTGVPVVRRPSRLTAAEKRGDIFLPMCRTGDGRMRSRLSRGIVAMAAVALLALALAGSATAGEASDGLFGAGIGELWGRLLAGLAAVQHDLHRELAAAMRALKAEGEAAAWGLVWLGFVYGVFHAAGPGHGKVVISTYMLTHESRLARGLAISVLSALVQGLTAVLAVEVTVALLDLSFRDANATATHLDHLSYALVALVGLMLAAGAGRRLFARANAVRERAIRHDGHGHERCGHTHGPSAAALQLPLSWRQTVAIVLSIGLRPCSGAVLVLLFAHVLGLHWAGIAAVAAMSAGTALTVSALAAVAVYARKLALHLTAALPEGRGRMGAIVDGIACAGGLLVMALGLSLLYGGLTASPHPLL